MKNKFKEIFAGAVVIIILIGTPLAISLNAPWMNLTKKRVIHLTGLASQGIWTEDLVTATNNGSQTFKRANIVLTQDEEVIFRFTSADVTHTFYAPEIGFGPIVVEAGHYYDVPFTPKVTGKFEYYCTTFCGHCHNYMRGNIVVLSHEQIKNTELAKKLSTDTVRADCCAPNPALAAGSSISFIKRGQLLFIDKGCFTCHGQSGIGGVFNPNYVNRTIPDLITLAKKLKIGEKKEADSLIKLLERGVDLDKLNDSPPFPSFSRFYAQYNSITQKILNGAPVVQKADSKSFTPPLLMPSWEYHLTRRDINSIIAYFISIYNWDND
ncbi:MAG: Cytochrome c oxidase polypeptide [Ignavibacteria bacterium]|nr:Cytochrome c oxidase polypeptide [Ignavibacteria bacterium]